MFERITFRQHDKFDADSPIDIGLLLESMLFYKKTSVISNGPAILKQLIRTFGFDDLNELIDRGILEVIYSETMTGIHTNTAPNGFELHDTVIFSSPQHSFPIEVRKACVEITGKEKGGETRSV